mgnify:CR=1 FL=1
MLHDFIDEYRRYRAIGERALAQIPDAALDHVTAPDGNSPAMLVRHLSGNLASRFTDFLVSDGEDLSTAELLRRAAAAMGRDARLLPVRASSGELALRAEEAAVRTESTLTLYDVLARSERLGHAAEYDDLIVDGYRRHPDEEYGPSLEYRPEGMKRVEAHTVIEKVKLAREKYVRPKA